MISYNLKYINGTLTFQPNRRYRNKIVICVLLALIAFALPEVWVLNYELCRLIQCFGILFTIYALYDLLFKVNLTYVFDPLNGVVYLKIPGLYSRKLMAFEDVHLLPETVNCELHYVMSNKKDRYGKNYAISDFFLETRKGKEERERYETEVLYAVEEILYTGSIN